MEIDGFNPPPPGFSSRWRHSPVAVVELKAREPSFKAHKDEIRKNFNRDGYWAFRMLNGLLRIHLRFVAILVIIIKDIATFK